jgi:hypothetical protein
MGFDYITAQPTIQLDVNHHPHIGGVIFVLFMLGGWPIYLFCVCMGWVGIR